MLKSFLFLSVIDNVKILTFRKSAQDVANLVASWKNVFLYNINKLEADFFEKLNNKTYQIKFRISIIKLGRQTIIINKKLSDLPISSGIVYFILQKL